MYHVTDHHDVTAKILSFTASKLNIDGTNEHLTQIIIDFWA